MLFLRPCIESDITSAARLMCEAYNQPPWNEEWQMERALRRISYFMSGVNTRGYAMLVERDTVGYLFGRLDVTMKGDVFYVEEIFVHPNYQRKGCGSMALGQLADELKTTGVNRIELHTISEDISFYEKNGFSPSSHKYLEKEI